ncbi:MAG: NAD(P)H-dependent oxidoreductase [Patescibacteria group bacterium]
MNTYNLLAISGSLREKSYNTMLAHAFKALAPEGVDITIADISTLPLFNQDLEADFPKEASDLKALISGADGILVITPEYNRGVPGVLKNAIDWTSRPYGQGAWNGKPVFVAGASVGAVGTALSQASLRQSMLFMGALVLGQPEFYLGSAQDKFAEDGTLTDESTKEHIRGALSAFTAFIDKLR